MFTNRRLTEVFQSAAKYHIDKDSKYVFFSDLHRGDDSISDEFSRNQVIMMAAMEYYYDHGYTYVEVGDGDELWGGSSNQI